MQPEEIRAGRWVDVGPFKIFDNWTVFPAGGRDARHVYDDPAAKMDFLIPDYRLTSSVTDGAELSATAHLTAQPVILASKSCCLRWIRICASTP
jgi:hypothetical protein